MNIDEHKSKIDSRGNIIECLHRNKFHKIIAIKNFENYSKHSANWKTGRGNVPSLAVVLKPTDNQGGQI